MWSAKGKQKMDASPPRSARHSWVLLGASFVTFMVSSACMQSYTVFLVAFIEVLNATAGRTVISLGAPILSND